MNIRRVLLDVKEDGPEIKAVEEGENFNQKLIFPSFSQNMTFYLA